MVRIKKSKGMIAAEAKLGGALDELLPDIITHLGMVDAAKTAGVSKATLGYWMLKLRMRRAYICLREGEQVFIRRRDGAMEQIEEG